MFSYVATVLPHEDYTLDLVFEDGKSGRFHTGERMTRKPWSRLADNGDFMKVKAAFGSVVWPGDIDIAPETLYEETIVG